jgi:hypothetical protein
MFDPNVFFDAKRDTLMEEAERERLIAQLPSRGWTSRRSLAIACHRLANWLDGSLPDQYFSPAETGPVAWVRPSVRM